MIYNYGWPLIKTKEALDRKQSCAQKILKKVLKNIFTRVAQVQAGKLRFRFTDIHYVCSHASFYNLPQTHY